MAHTGRSVTMATAVLFLLAVTCLEVAEFGEVLEFPENPEDICSTVQCGLGRECIIKEDGNPTCVCKSMCPDRDSPLCGSTGITYNNPCEMHRAACIEGITINKLHNGLCTAEEMPKQSQVKVEMEEKPLVCYMIERDQLRKMLIDWLESKVEEDGFFLKGKSYDEVLSDKFGECDLDSDLQLNAEEFVSCVEKNDTVRDLHSDQVTGHILRTLCVDALIALVDKNSDWLLDLEEFKQCMNTSFSPTSKKCSLEEKTYEDGAETKVKCNICVCACGNWVCTAASCHGKDGNIEEYTVEQGSLPSAEDRKELLEGFEASEHVDLEKIGKEVISDASLNSKAGDIASSNKSTENDVIEKE